MNAVDLLDDSIDDLFGGNTAADVAARNPNPYQITGLPQTYREPCKACNGSGRFTSWAGRTVGQCFTCKGQGFKVFKQSPDKRAQQKAYAAKAKQRKQDDVASMVEEFIAANPAEYAWMNSNPNFEFAIAMKDALLKYGALTERQLGAVRSCVVKAEARNAARKAEKAAIETNAPAVNVVPMIDAFASAQAKGIKRPKVRIEGFKFSLAPLTGSNAGAIYVVRDEVYLGKIADGKFIRMARNCSLETEAQIVVICQDPKKAAIAHGRRTGNCACCGRELTNHASIDLGIGPICAEKYGW